MDHFILGGTTNYGQIVGILMLESTIPRLPGDPGHAATFAFPVRYGVIHKFPFEDLVEIRDDNIDRILTTAIELQNEGVNFIVADCGLFSPFQSDIANALDIPFIGSSLNLIPLLAGLFGSKKKIGLVTGHTAMLKKDHLLAAGADAKRLVIRGMEHSEEFQKVIIQRGQKLNPAAMQAGVLAAVEDIFSSGDPIGAIVLECTNLIHFRSHIQKQFDVPVFDMVSLVEFFAEGYRLKAFQSSYISGSGP